MTCCSKCGKEVNQYDKFCPYCGGEIIKVKKSKKPLYIILACIVGFIIIKNVATMIKKVQAKNSYDAIVVADNCSCGFYMFEDCKFTYGIKDHIPEKLSIKMKEDYSNIYTISANDDIKTFLSKDLWYEMYKENNYTEPIPTKLIRKYEEKMNYWEHDKEAFDYIISLVKKEDLEYMENFIITKNNYYLFSTLDNTIYRYSEEAHRLEVYATVNMCKLTYFYEKK